MDHPEYRSTVRLVLLGGARNQEDMARVSSLGALATELDVEVAQFDIRTSLSANMCGSPAAETGDFCCKCVSFGCAEMVVLRQHWTEHNGGRTFRDQYC